MDSTPLVRPAMMQDLPALTEMRCDIWPDGSRSEHETEAKAIINGKPQSTLPLVVFIAELDTHPVGFVEVGLRSHADGCDATRPVGFIEGWYVVPEQRKKGIGTLLISAAENWAREQGCTEMASDTWANNQPSIDAHKALGFEVTDTIVTFRKALI